MPFSESPIFQYLSEKGQEGSSGKIFISFRNGHVCGYDSYQGFKLLQGVFYYYQTILPNYYQTILPKWSTKSKKTYRATGIF